MKGIVLVLVAMMLTALVMGLTASETVDYESYHTEDLVIKTLESPVEIWTLDDLNNIRNNLNGHYILMDDIDAFGYK